VLAVVIIGALASIATSKVTQKGEAPFPTTTLQVHGPPAELRIRVATRGGNMSRIKLSAKVTLDQVVPRGKARLRFEYVRADGSAGDALIVDAADPGPWYAGVSLSGCPETSCSAEIVLRIHLAAPDLDTEDHLTLRGRLEASIHNGPASETPISITATLAP
jgi:hypothetical protein